LYCYRYRCPRLLLLLSPLLLLLLLVLLDGAYNPSISMQE
jgi:hypothetical protein